MLVNKLIIEYGYMFVRSIDPRYLKYIMDLGISPLVINCDGNTIISLQYVSLDYMNSCRYDFNLPNVRPLTVSEIKSALELVSMTIHFYKHYEFYLWQTFFVHFPQTYIDRNKLWKKY